MPYIARQPSFHSTGIPAERQETAQQQRPAPEHRHSTGQSLSTHHHRNAGRSNFDYQLKQPTRALSQQDRFPGFILTERHGYNSGYQGGRAYLPLAHKDFADYLQTNPKWPGPGDMMKWLASENRLGEGHYIPSGMSGHFDFPKNIDLDEAVSMREQMQEKLDAADKAMKNGARLPMHSPAASTVSLPDTLPSHYQTQQLRKPMPQRSQSYQHGAAPLPPNALHGFQRSTSQMPSASQQPRRQLTQQERFPGFILEDRHQFSGSYKGGTISMPLANQHFADYLSTNPHWPTAQTAFDWMMDNDRIKDSEYTPRGMSDPRSIPAGIDLDDCPTFRSQMENQLREARTAMNTARLEIRHEAPHQQWAQTPAEAPHQAWPQTAPTSRRHSWQQPPSQTLPYPSGMPTDASSVSMPEPKDYFSPQPHSQAQYSYQPYQADPMRHYAYEKHHALGSHANTSTTSLDSGLGSDGYMTAGRRFSIDSRTSTHGSPSSIYPNSGYNSMASSTTSLPGTAHGGQVGKPGVLGKHDFPPTDAMRPSLGSRTSSGRKFFNRSVSFGKQVFDMVRSELSSPRRRNSFSIPAQTPATPVTTNGPVFFRGGISKLPPRTYVSDSGARSVVSLDVTHSDVLEYVDSTPGSDQSPQGLVNFLADRKAISGTFKSEGFTDERPLDAGWRIPISNSSGMENYMKLLLAEANKYEG